MGIFRQWLEAIEKQPAIVRQHVDPIQARRQVQVLKNITQHVVKGLTDLLDFGQAKTEVSEASKLIYAKQVFSWEEKIFGKGCHELCEFIRKYVPGYNGEKPKKRVCGTEGCAYFFDGIVLKATLGEAEFKLASMMAGREEVVPVIDTMAFKGAYFILMHKTVIQFASKIKREIENAGIDIMSYFSKILEEGYSIERHLNVEVFRKYLGNEITKTGERLFTIIVEIFKTTGYIIHRDISSDNVGLIDDVPYLFDLGYPRKVSHDFGVPMFGKVGRRST